MTNDELNRLVCERVLGWEWKSPPAEETRSYTDCGLCTVGWWDRGDGKQWTKHFNPKHNGQPLVEPVGCPGFCGDWAAFGVLWDALVDAGRSVEIWAYSPRHSTSACVDNTRIDDPDPRRALVLAALKAYGVEV